MKRQHMAWKKIFEKSLYDEELLSKIHEELLQLSNKKPQITQLKMDKETWVDISAKKTYKLPTSIENGAQHH